MYLDVCLRDDDRSLEGVYKCTWILQPKFFILGICRNAKVDWENFNTVHVVQLICRINKDTRLTGIFTAWSEGNGSW